MKARPVLVLLLAAVTAGCVAVTTPANPTFPVTTEQAAGDLTAMELQRKPLERPLVIIGGYADPGFGVSTMRRRLRRIVTTPDLLIAAPMLWPPTFDAAAARLVRLIEDAAPSDDPERTVEVDVIGLSMGGLVARYAATPGAPGGKRVLIRRLFTLATPHRGAAMASGFTLDPKVRDMAAGSAFLQALDEAARSASYEVVPYARLGDGIVGAENAAWIDGTLWWLPSKPFEFAHHVAGDIRVAADIARRLRGESAYTAWPPAPLPE